MKLSNIKLVSLQNVLGTAIAHDPHTVESLAQQALKTETLPAPIQVKFAGTTGEGFDTEYLYEAVGDKLMLAVARRVREISPRVGETAPVSIVDGFDVPDEPPEDSEEEMVRKAREATEFSILGCR